MKFEELYTRRYSGQISQEQAAEILGVTTRTFRRWEDRYEAERLDSFLAPLAMQEPECRGFIGEYMQPLVFGCVSKVVEIVHQRSPNGLICA